MIKDSYLVLDDREIWTEKQCRNFLLEEEINDIKNNWLDYKEEFFNISNQLDCIYKASNSNMNYVIETLEKSWAVPILDLTKDFYYNGVRVDFKKLDKECISVDFYNNHTKELLDADIEIYYKGDFVKYKNRNFEETLEFYIDENFNVRKKFCITEKCCVRFGDTYVYYGKLKDGNYYVKTEFDFQVYSKDTKDFYEKVLKFDNYENCGLDNYIIDTYELDDIFTMNCIPCNITKGECF